MPAYARNHGVIDEVNGIGGARIFCLAVVVIVGDPGVRIEGYILQHAAEAESIPDLGFVLLRELDAFGVTSAFKVEHTGGAPAVFVIADQIPRRIGRERRLAGPGESKKKR